MHRIIAQTLVVLFLLLAASITCGADCTPEGFMPLDSLSEFDVFCAPRTAWLKHAYWPREKTIEAKLADGEELKAEYATLQHILAQTVRPQFRPTDQQVADDALRLLSLWEDTDYTLIRYKTADGHKVQLQDGKELYILVLLPEDAGLDVMTRVMHAAEIVLQLPEFALDNFSAPPLWNTKTTTFDSGLFFIQPSASDTKDWFNTLPWWADDKRVMFRITKSLLPQALETTPEAIQ